ncbi:MAG: flagellar hook assembly protein FlgD [Oligoflexia bacterium]|nr:flagellar hook assembly protein FlgD [Oligoflexia bacterium]
MADVGSVNSFAAAAQEGASLGAKGQKDRKEPDSGTQFGDVLKRMQAQYGAKAEKPREIKKTLGKDDFLRIMITQMKNQDPTNPFKAEQMAAEMAQFTSVEQLQNMNQSLQKMSNQNPAERMVMTNLIGKTVTVDKDRFPHVEGQNESLAFTLPKESKQTHVALISETGEVVLEKDIGPQKKGENTFVWDGLKSNTLQAKGGNYILRIEATDEHDNPIQTDPRAKARVIGVSFEGSEPVLLVGDNKNQAKITMKSVVKVESDFSAGAAQTQAGGEADAADKPKFFTFRKGEGSSNLDPSTASPEVAAALAKYGQPQADNALAKPEFRPAMNAGAAAAADSKEKGFPNGLQD